MKSTILRLAALLAPVCLASAQSLATQTLSPSDKDAARITAPISVPVNQLLTPAGIQVELPGLRPQVIALSPDGSLLVTSGKTPELVVIDPRNGNILQRVPLPSGQDPETPGEVSEYILKPDKGGQASYTGLIFSPDGKRIFLSNVAGSIKVFAVQPDRKVVPAQSIKLPKSGLSQHESDVPAGLALSSDGERLRTQLLASVTYTSKITGRNSAQITECTNAQLLEDRAKLR
jgi:DNA-binding beta-propeller fold protein YncE